MAYEWDLVGNLKKRKDLNQSNLTEEFFYDNLYRLDYSTLNSVQNLNVDYDALGNITSKLDVGAYTYHPTKKHQVASTSNGWSFSYDANGNMQSGAGRANTWTSYNYLASAENGANTAAFSYTPDRQYYKQVSNYASGGTATTMYIGGLLEKVTTSAGTDFRHLIRAGSSTIIVSRQSGGSNTVNYVTSDHLGSSSAITDGSGGILMTASFDAFGKRRGSNWSGSPSAADWAAIADTTRRGYTEHSMLDNLNLVHMNGRVQDPVLGRFVSADQFITEPGNTQNFNRYSYVYNNPLSALDPSGFAENDDEDEDEVVVTGHTEAPRISDSNPGWGLYDITQQIQNLQGFGNISFAEPYPLVDGKQEVLVCATCKEQTASSAQGSRPGFWDAHGFVWNSLSMGAWNCFFNVGTRYACSNGEFAKEGGLYVAGQLPLAKMLGPLARGVVADAKFAQATFGKMFGAEGTFAGKSVQDVAAALRSGAMKASDVPVNYIVRDGQMIILNTRSAQALEAAGIPRAQWNGVNQTGNQFFEDLLNGQLGRNPGGPFDTVRPSGGP